MRFLLAIVVIVACRAAPQPPSDTLGTEHASATAHIAPPMHAEPSAAAQRLLAVANELDAVPADRARMQLAHALSALADTLETLVPTAAEAIVQVREASDAIAQTKQPRADVVRAGLDGATRALYELKLTQPGQRYQDTIDALALATAQIDRSRPLAEEYGDVRAAFHEAVRTVYAATNAPEPALTQTAFR